MQPSSYKVAAAYRGGTTRRGGAPEELRAAKSSYLNPKLPTPFALRILPTLPDNEVRLISKGAATSMPLKQAALKRLLRG